MHFNEHQFSVPSWARRIVAYMDGSYIVCAGDVPESLDVPSTEEATRWEWILPLKLSRVPKSSMEVPQLNGERHPQ